MIYDLFAGPGGWDQALATLGRSDVLGIEWDKAACDTASAAGHARLWADVAALDPHDIVSAFGPCEGLIASPPCQAWSMAGKQLGELDRANCHALADRMAAGDDTLDWTTWEDERSPLVCQPIRWVRELRPEWIALEEVPAVASLWKHFARIYRTWGYSVWTGDLCAADYGVGQERYRRILMAHRSMLAQPPEPTHREGGGQDDLFGGQRFPWVSMAAALRWGFDQAPFIQHERSGDRAEEGFDPHAGPSQALTSKTRSWVLRQTWIHERPATTVCADPRIFAPGWRGKPEDYSDDGTYHGARSGDDAVRVTVQEAGILQSFPADYPWDAAGSRTKAFQCVGNAIPPVLAAHILAALGVGQLPQAVAA